ncbi:ubiquitin carboxyl-terminal hydrolase puf [Drosophila obscura]|uniref:ubiquitin carboxyl-terminal hydrolase puf n=1 Tax=Drosophila obscura TaxID=7282 RepID=UPI001BB1AA70|nr:ubiquitin carboxyl-terminal hydrolase puf [Drosophila obscura]
MSTGLGMCATLVLCLALVQPAVIRPELDADSESEQETTTSPSLEGDVTTEEVTTSASPAFSRDEEASILIDPAPGTLQEDVAPQQKSAKLLLLSTPSKRTVEIERQLEEQDEGEDSKADAVESEAATAATTTPQPTADEQTTDSQDQGSPTAEGSESEETTTSATTKLFTIEGTGGEDAAQPNVAVSLAQDSVNTTVSIAEQPQVPGDNNAAVELSLVEPEAEYVLVESHGHPDELDLQLGSFTHIDSEVHLQPVVHSVEIVPTSFDDPLIVNYVHNLR